MHAVTFVVPGSLDARTGGSIYDRRMVEELRARGYTVDVRELDDSFPRPTAAALAGAARVLAEIPDAATVIVDGLALGALPDEAGREAGRLRLVGLVHMPLADEIGLDSSAAARLQASEQRALRSAALIVVTGRRTAERLVECYGVAPESIAVVEPGTDRAPLARGSNGSQLRLLSVGTLNPGKGHEILVRALAAVGNRDWTLTCAGNLERHPETFERLRVLIRELGLRDHVSLVGELNETMLAMCYDSADLFVLATLHETYGMAVAEALARGLPIVSTTTGAIPDLLGEGDAAAGLLVPPDDVGALTDALNSVLDDASLRARLAGGAARVRDRLPTWDEACGKMAAALECPRINA